LRAPRLDWNRRRFIFSPTQIQVGWLLPGLILPLFAIQRVVNALRRRSDDMDDNAASVPSTGPQAAST
jgi:hypothetical protein